MNTHKKTWFVFILGLLLFSLFLTACQSAETVPEAAAGEEGPIVIGVSLPLSGRMAGPGVAARRDRRDRGERHGGHRGL